MTTETENIHTKITMQYDDPNDSNKEPSGFCQFGEDFEENETYGRECFMCYDGKRNMKWVQMVLKHIDWKYKKPIYFDMKNNSGAGFAFWYYEDFDESFEFHEIKVDTKGLIYMYQRINGNFILSLCNCYLNDELNIGEKKN